MRDMGCKTSSNPQSTLHSDFAYQRTVNRQMSMIKNCENNSKIEINVFNLRKSTKCSSKLEMLPWTLSKNLQQLNRKIKFTWNIEIYCSSSSMIRKIQHFNSITRKVESKPNSHFIYLNIIKIYIILVLSNYFFNNIIIFDIYRYNQQAVNQTSIKFINKIETNQY